MILSCNSCGKKFVVPDQAITSLGRIVQCGSCGNKWKQFPIKNEIKNTTFNDTVNDKKTTPKIKIPKTKKKRVQKKREIDLYSPEYLAKKHGITIKKEIDNKPLKAKVSFGFYNTLIFLIVVIIALSKGLHFFQDLIVLKLPFTEIYLNYFFESIKNVFEIWRDLVTSY